MKIQYFSQSGWNSLFLNNLNKYELNGIELTGYEGGIIKNNVNVLVTLFRLVRAVGEKDSRIWLLTGHTTVQADNRIVRYRKLWTSLGFDISNFEFSNRCEWPVRTDTGIRFFGVAEVPYEKFVNNDWLRSIKNLNSCWFVVADPTIKIQNFQNELALGWNVNSTMPDATLLNFTIQKQIFLIHIFDSKEEGEGGGLLIAKNDRVISAFNLLKSIVV